MIGWRMANGSLVAGDDIPDWTHVPACRGNTSMVAGECMGNLSERARFVWIEWRFLCREGSIRSIIHRARRHHKIAASA